MGKITNHERSPAMEKAQLQESTLSFFSYLEVREPYLFRKSHCSAVAWKARCTACLPEGAWNALYRCDTPNWLVERPSLIWLHWPEKQTNKQTNKKDLNKLLSKWTVCKIQRHLGLPGSAILKVVSLVSRLLDREALVHAHQYKS